MGLDRPRPQAEVLVVEEDPAIPDRRRSLEIDARRDEQFVPLVGEDIGPPVPRRDADPFGQLVDAVGGPARIAPSDQQRALEVDSGWRLDGRDRVPFRAVVETMVRHALVEGTVEFRASSVGPDDDCPSAAVGESRLDRGLAIAHPLDVVGEILGRDPDDRFGPDMVDRRRPAFIDELERLRRGFRSNRHLGFTRSIHSTYVFRPCT